jgi:hypothetical protein
MEVSEEGEKKGKGLPSHVASAIADLVGHVRLESVRDLLDVTALVESFVATL